LALDLVLVDWFSYLDVGIPEMLLNSTKCYLRSVVDLGLSRTPFSPEYTEDNYLLLPAVGLHQILFLEEPFSAFFGSTSSF
jgi:hypothetical protein